MSSPRTYIIALDRIQQRLEQLTNGAHCQEGALNNKEDSLEHRRDVATRYTDAPGEQLLTNERFLASKCMQDNTSPQHLKTMFP